MFLHDPFFQRFRIGKDLAPGAPAGNSLHLRVGGCADDDGQLSGFLCLCHQVMDPFYKGTGCVDDFCPLLFQPFVNFPTDTMGADDYGIAGLRLLRLLNDLDAHLLKTLHHMAVVDDGAKGKRTLSFLCRCFHQFHRPAYAEAKAGTFGYRNAHGAVFSRIIFKSAATVSSIFISEVSTLMLSRTIFSGAISRWVSW